MRAKKKPRSFETGLLEIRNSRSRLATAAELVLELFDATSGVDETLLTSEGRVRVRSDVANDDLVFNTVDFFSLATTHCGASEEFVTSRNVDECDVIELRMDISFHRRCLLIKLID